MRVTELQLYNMICESINNALMEADGPDIDGTFNNNYKEKTSKNKALSDNDLETQVANDVEQGNTSVAGQQEQQPGWKQHAKNLWRNGKLGAAAIGAGWVASLAGSLIGAGGLVAGVCSLAIPIGLGALGANLLGNGRAMGRVSKLKMPNTYSTAFRYGKYAVAERSNAQTICLNVQQNLKNAIDAWNLAYPGETYTWETVLTEIQNAGQNTKVNFETTNGENAEVDVDINKNFTDRYVGKNESKKSWNKILTESDTPDVSNASKSIKSSAEYKTIFEKDKMLGAKYLTVLGTMYIQAYSLWMKWTRYINQIVHKFSKQGLTWETLIDYDGSIIDKAKHVGAKLINQTLGTHIKPGSKQDVGDYRGKNDIKVIDIRIIEPTYNGSFTLVQALLNNTFFSIPKVVCEKGEQLQIKYSPTFIEKKYNDKRYGGMIYQLNNKSLE